MPRSYRPISEYENEIIEMWNKGKSLRAVAETLGFTHKQVQEFKTRYNKKQRMIDAGEALRRKGRPCKQQVGGLPVSIQQLDKVNQMRYVMASKDRYIKRLEMEIKLMRDFLSLKERM